MPIDSDMSSKDNLVQLVRKWDEGQILGDLNEDNQESIPIEGPYLNQWDLIETLASTKYKPYTNDEIQDFFGKFWSWLMQFELERERKLAFKIAARITFITEEQIKYLQEVCFKEKLQYSLFEKIISDRKLPPYAYKEASRHFDDELSKCLLIPLTDSARYNQFVHVNGLENHSQLGIGSLSVFVHPDIRNTPEAVERLNKRYSEKETLVIIEDFCGSGKTFTSDLVRIANLYGFKRIYFCPYIITEKAERVIIRFARMFVPNIKVEILYGMKLSDRHNVFSPSSHLFSYEEQIALKQLCVKYHKKYFLTNRFIGLTHPYPFGYRNGQLLVVMQSNCPNHTLPIIWASDNGWQPLFRRVQRYA